MEAGKDDEVDRNNSKWAIPEMRKVLKFLDS